MNRRPWKRLAALRASRRRGTELPSAPREPGFEPIPPLEPPDDDREFLPWPRAARPLRLEAA